LNQLRKSYNLPAQSSGIQLFKDDKSDIHNLAKKMISKTPQRKTNSQFSNQKNNFSRNAAAGHTRTHTHGNNNSFNQQTPTPTQRNNHLLSLKVKLSETVTIEANIYKDDTPSSVADRVLRHANA
jgi:hypothetical protein